MDQFYGMTFYNVSNATNTTQQVPIETMVENERNVTAVSIAAGVFVVGMLIGTTIFCIRQRITKKPAFDEI